MKVTIEGTKAELMELLAEIRRRDKEYTILPSPYYVTPTYNPCNPPTRVTTTTAHSGFTADEWYRQEFGNET